MSYLQPPRLTFAGQFQADPSTVNNDPTHFNNATFIPSYQDYQTSESANGWWNPDGTGNWRLIGCKITSVTYKDGTSTTDPAKDPIIGMSVMDADSRVAAKLVDLDPQQQMVSEIWGLIVKITADGKELMKGEYETAAFTNLWFTKLNVQPSDAGDGTAGASYQSIIKNISWEDIENSGSRFLKELKMASPKQLSIQFNVDLYNDDHTKPPFTLGRMVGSIGPSGTDEPKHFVLGRQLFPQTGGNSYATAVVDEKLKSLVLDMGNALQFNPLDKEKVSDIGPLGLFVNQGSVANPDYISIGEINYRDPAWYYVHSGITVFELSDEILALANKFPLCILSTSSTPGNLLFSESAGYVCADQYVFRLNPGESCQVDFYATNLAKPLANQSVYLQIYSDAFGPTPPCVCTPTSVVSFPVTVNTDSNGKASITITASDPGNPRGYIDGQVYGISYNLSDQKFANCNQSNFISLLLFNSVPESSVNNPDWETDIQPIMQQYANLYPLMSKGIFNLADQQVVHDNAEILKFVFSKEKTDPNYMPATRDLSRDKQKMIINYLDGILNSEATKEAITFRKS